MDNMFFTATIISIIFLFLKFIEMRFIEKESKPLKYLIRDTIVVFFSVVSGFFILDQLKPIMSGGNNLSTNNTPIFIDNPEF
jgi:TctA family transporter